MKHKPPIGVTLGTGGVPVLAFIGKNGSIEMLSGGHDDDVCFYPEYFPGDCIWPVDPYTGKELPAADIKHYVPKHKTLWNKISETVTRVFRKPL
jgi:hypothetical protein